MNTIFQKLASTARFIKDKVTGEKSKGSAAVNINEEDVGPGQKDAIRQLLAKHEKLFLDKLGLANEPEQDWMRINLLRGAEKEIKPQRQYHLGPKEHELVDKVFDEQRQEGCLVDTPNSPTGWPVFVVKRSGAKWRPVIDLRVLNKLIAPDVYPLPCQDEIVTVLKGKYWLSIFDIRSAYY